MLKGLEIVIFNVLIFFIFFKEMCQILNHLMFDQDKHFLLTNQNYLYNINLSKILLSTPLNFLKK